MNSKTYTIANIGSIEVCKHHSTKKLTIKLKPGSIPKVVIPKLMTYEMGYRFALEKENWIVKHNKKLEERIPKTIFNEENGFETRFHKISIQTHLKNSIELKRYNDSITIYYPATSNIASTAVQEKIKNSITEVLRFEAKKHLIPRTFELAQKYNFTVNKIFVKNLKSRWGSCSAQNNINLNVHLMRLPEDLSDFIILHELCHTVHKNHGSHFHSLLNKLVGNEKELNKELKKYNTQL
ncbi:MAG: SprT family zinc-dependent metalloprotease [Salinivirgaceae bacterium]|jgi:predicted metal-dependent hydrolase|nr:SprT family zinc-dependent metalloprotease [Salinivirgaceae bacterium]